MNLKDPDTMNNVVGNALRVGVVTSAVIILFGTVLLMANNGLSTTSNDLTYNTGRVPHGSFDISLSGLFSGVASLQPYSIIELGVIVLLATPVTRVIISVLLFAAEGDKAYVYITAVVLTLLLFSMLVTPFIPLFHA